ncbi:hypothetical protein K440DRAFT_685798 [Wilcoxina mikolae CBS 423.85]|nr:hypothetical protein K440DRAFT_685798 [Wilcoxina mikolae CBS 423.85]
MLALVLLGFADALPLTHPTGPASPSYVPGPRGRGTVDLLLSATITLTICVYTSIHLNITPRKSYIFGIQKSSVYKFYWVLVALVAPEFVLFAAYDQWRNARDLAKS